MSPSRKPPDFVVLVNSLYIRIGLRDFYFSKKVVKCCIVSSIGTGEGLVNVYRGTGKILVAPIDDLGEEKAIENTSSSNANPDSQTASKSGTALKLINSFLDD